MFDAKRAGSTIPQVDPGAFYRSRAEAALQAFARVLDSGRYILGEEVLAFEREFAAYAKVGHAIGVANGTDALALALRALGVGPGDRVATVSHTAVATVAAIRMLGACPVLLDISPSFYTLEAEHLNDALAALPPVKAVVVVHIYGQPADAAALAAVAQRHGARLVEDCAQAHGASLNGTPVGTVGAAASFSFYPTKNLGALGDGGLVATGDSDIAAAIRMLREYGWRERHFSECDGINSRLDELQAALLRLRLAHLAANNERRAAIAAAYTRGLGRTGLPLPTVRPGGTHVFHQYVIRHPQREALRARMAQSGIQTNVHYPVPVHLQPAFRDRCELAPGGLPHSEAAAREVLSLPMYAEIDDEAVQYVIDTLCKAL